MSDLIRKMCCRSCEQEQRETLRAMARLARAARPEPTQAPPVYTPKPLVPSGIQPVFVVNMPLRVKR